MAAKSDLLQGTLDLLVLNTLQGEPMHGWDIAQRIQQLSEDVLRVNQGSLYPALHRLVAQDLLESEWGESENNRRAKFYRLTALGKKRLAAESQEWERFTWAVARVLQGILRRRRWPRDGCGDCSGAGGRCGASRSWSTSSTTSCATTSSARPS